MLYKKELLREPKERSQGGYQFGWEKKINPLTEIQHHIHVGDDLQ